MIKKVLVVGAGTMGIGIAQVCAQSGIEVDVIDRDPIIVKTNSDKIKVDLNKRVAAGKAQPGVLEALKKNLRPTSLSDIHGRHYDLVIEVIIELYDAKASLYKTLDEEITFTYLATNTSSLSVTSLARSVAEPGRFLGLHFFNPAQQMKLVEVIAGENTAGETITFGQQFCQQIGKTSVVAMDSPGFIVNRVARGYYAESIYLHEQTGMPIKDIDALMQSVGFRLGPFALMDLIGHDINLAVTTSVYEALGYPSRFAPSKAQSDLVNSGKLGKKTGEGFYTYGNV